MLQTLKNPFAILDGEVLHVDQALPLGGPYLCPGCEGRLIYNRESIPHSRTGNRRRAHFSHMQAECATGFETGLHLWAKRLIAERREIAAPDYYLTHLDRPFSFEAPVAIAEVQLEPWQDGIRPDLLLVGPDGSETHVEIFVTHAVGLEKEDILKERGACSFEIDLSGFKLDDLDDETLADAILQSAPRRWIHHARISEWERQAADIWAADKRCAAQLVAETVATPPKRPERSDEKSLDELIADYGLEPFVGRDLGPNHWFIGADRYWQARLLKEFVVNMAGQAEDILYSQPPKAARFTNYDPKRDPELLPLVQPWPGQRTDVDLADPYVLEQLEEHFPDVASPRLLAMRYFETLIGELDREGHPIGRRLIEKADNTPLRSFRIYRPWADYVTRKDQLLAAFLKAGRRIPMKKDFFRVWYKSPLPESQQRPRAITAAGGPEFIRLLARLEAISNMVDGGWAVDDCMHLEEERFRNQMRARPVQPQPMPAAMHYGQSFYLCTSMKTFETCGRDVAATLTQIARNQLGGGAHAFLTRPDDELGGISPLEFAVDVPTMQFAMRKLPPLPGAQGRRRLW